MGFLEALFRWFKPAPVPPAGALYSDADIQAVAAMAQRHVDVVNESLRFAVDSQNLETRLSRLALAKQKVEETKQLAATFSFLRLTSLAEVELTIMTLEQQFQAAGYQDLADGNSGGEAFEREGRVQEAIAEYERLLQRQTDTPFTYRRLAILYRKAKSVSDEVRVLQAALKCVPSSNAVHYNWFRDRLQKCNKRIAG